MGRSPWCATDSVLNRGPWTAQEDLILRNYISIHGEGRWKALPKNAGLNRCGKSCRLRWLNYLRPNIKRGNISPDEEELIIRMHKLLGNRWSLIAGRLPGRTDNEIKNYWNTHLSKTRVPEMEMIQQPHTAHTKSKRAHIEGRIAKRRKLYVGSGDSDHQELKSSDVEEAVKASKCWCDIVDPAITENICESMEINYELNVNDGPFQHSQHYSDKEVGTFHVLKEILSYWECDILFSPCDNFRFKEVVARSSDELDQMCFLESTVDDDRGMAEIYSDTQQLQVDWVNELVCLDMWEERSSNIFSQKMSI